MDRINLDRLTELEKDISLGELYQRKGEYATAVDILSRASHTNPFNPIIHNNLAVLYNKLDRKEGTVVELKRFRLLTHQEKDNTSQK